MARPALCPAPADGRRRTAHFFGQPWSAGGRLALGELDERLDRVHGVRTLGESAVASRGLYEPAPRDSLVVDRAPTSRFALGVFGGFAREGRWVVPERFTSWSMWGGGSLDLSAARFSSQESVIRAVALWGGTEIVVPDGIDVEARGIGLFGAVVTKPKPAGK